MIVDIIFAYESRRARSLCTSHSSPWTGGRGRTKWNSWKGIFHEILLLNFPHQWINGIGPRGGGDVSTSNSPLLFLLKIFSSKDWRWSRQANSWTTSDVKLFRCCCSRSWCNLFALRGEILGWVQNWFNILWSKALLKLHSKRLLDSALVKMKQKHRNKHRRTLRAPVPAFFSNAFIMLPDSFSLCLRSKRCSHNVVHIFLFSAVLSFQNSHKTKFAQQRAEVFFHHKIKLHRVTEDKEKERNGIFFLSFTSSLNFSRHEIFLCFKKYEDARGKKGRKKICKRHYFRSLMNHEKWEARSHAGGIYEWYRCALFNLALLFLAFQSEV